MQVTCAGSLVAGTLADARTVLPVLALMAARTGIATLSIAGQPGAGDIAAKGETGRKVGLRCWTNRTDDSHNTWSNYDEPGLRCWRTALMS